MDGPASLAFSPDSRLLTYLWSEDGDLSRDLWALDVATGELCLECPAALVDNVKRVLA